MHPRSTQLEALGAALRGSAAAPAGSWQDAHPEQWSWRPPGPAASGLRSEATREGVASEAPGPASASVIADLHRGAGWNQRRGHRQNSGEVPGRDGDGIVWGANPVWTPVTFAAEVDKAIAGPLGWTRSGAAPITYPADKLTDASWSFQRVSGAQYSVLIRLATPDTVVQPQTVARGLGARPQTESTRRPRRLRGRLPVESARRPTGWRPSA